MKAVFIINPRAGQGKNIQQLIASIHSIANLCGKEVQVYLTKAVDDARQFVESYCESFGAARFIACGGDGTLNEVLNGVIGCQGAEVGVIPIGTGNDFCRNFAQSGFKSIESQLTGNCIACDAIKYRTHVNGIKKEGYCANMFNIGFDCNVADLTSSIKKVVPIGPLAYFLSILLTLIKKRGCNLKIELDGMIRHNGKLLLTSIANGSYCGGGIKSNPLADISDGLININIIKNISRLRFISLLPHYMKGTFLRLSKIDKVILSEKCQRVTITPYSEHIRLCIDGEITDAGKTEFEIVPGAFNFVAPEEAYAKSGSLSLSTK